MKKILILTTLCITLLAFGCKKDESKQKDIQGSDNLSNQSQLTDMTQFKQPLSVLQNPQYDLLYKLIEKGINAQTEEDITIAYPKTTKRLILNTPEVTIQKGATPLGIAALFCTPGLVNDLIEKGADLKATINGQEISAYIIQCGQAEQAGMLENYLKHVRIDVEQKQPEIYKNKQELYAANALIKDNITDAEGMGKTLMNYAVENKLNDVIPVLLKYAGAVNYTNEKDPLNNKKPIITAIESENFEALKILLSKTGSLFSKTTLEDGSKIAIIDYIFYKYNNALVEKNNIEPSIFLKSLINGYGKKAGMEEIKSLFAKSINAALEEEVVVNDNITFPKGTTIAHIAARFNYNAIIKGLSFYSENTETNKNALLNKIDDNYNTPLHIAVQNGNTAAVKTLLESGVMLNIKNNNSNTPLESTVLEYTGNKSADMAKMILTSSLINIDSGMDSKEFLDEAEKNKSLKNLIQKLDFQYLPFLLNNTAYLYKENIKSYVKEYEGNTRLFQAGIENTLPFSIKLGDNVTLPAKASPIIAAAVLCNEQMVNNLILAKADLNYRIQGPNDLKFNAYDFADRMAQFDCTKVKELLSNPSKAKLNDELYNKYLENPNVSYISINSMDEIKKEGNIEDADSMENQVEEKSQESKKGDALFVVDEEKE